MWYQRDEWGDLGMLDIVSCGEALHRPLKGGVYFVLFLIYFWPCCMACRILVPCPGIEPGPLALGGQSLTHWTTGEVSTCTS